MREKHVYLIERGAAYVSHTNTLHQHPYIIKYTYFPRGNYVIDTHMAINHNVTVSSFNMTTVMSKC